MCAHTCTCTRATQRDTSTHTNAHGHMHARTHLRCPQTQASMQRQGCALACGHAHVRATCLFTAGGATPTQSRSPLSAENILPTRKILKWRGTEEFKGKPYKLGYIMYVKRGEYWVNGKIMKLDPHFAIVLKKSYKRIKPKRIRDLLSPLKQKLRNGKPFGIYKDFPIIVKKTGHFSWLINRFLILSDKL